MPELPRLRLRPFVEADLATFAAYRSEPAVARYQDWDALSVREARRKVLGTPPILTPGGGWIQLAVVERAADALVGDVGACVSPDGTLATIGFTIAPRAQRRGYATEAVRGLLALIRARPAILCVEAVVDARNAPSIALLERVGLRRVHTAPVIFKGERAEEHHYALDLLETAAPATSPDAAERRTDPRGRTHRGR